MVGAWLNIVLVYLGKPLPCKGFADFFIESQGTPLIVVIADSFLPSIECLLIIVEVYKYQVWSFILFLAYF